MKNNAKPKITAEYYRSAVKNRKSIKKQKESLKNYACSQSTEKRKIYKDNGFSGSSLDRPALKKMIKDIKKGKISAVVVSDISRLSRNFVDCSILEKIFKENGVEFVALQKY